MGKGAPLAEGEGRSRPRRLGVTVGRWRFEIPGWAVIVLMTLSLYIAVWSVARDETVDIWPLLPSLVLAIVKCRYATNRGLPGMCGPGCCQTSSLETP